ncbi:hypothetical protein [Candidatus Marithrix sp. Canyon 246]|uniref:hypothetical protein n=1 Tax=Candidatus Marithrix sp. Canyon 246 TaxID=1827136 RepID=UPI00084A2742|nr:hypothetical protein [Candidatus Marithrix sp. Canyon 246]
MIYWRLKIFLIISLNIIYTNVEAIQCKRGKACGNACIAIHKTCRIEKDTITNIVIIYSWRDLKTGTLYISSEKPEWYQNPKWPKNRPFPETEIILFK